MQRNIMDAEKYRKLLAEDGKYKAVLDEYEAKISKLTWDLTTHSWYSDYIWKFTAVRYHVPNNLEHDFDRDFLARLIAASLSSEYVIERAREINGNNLPSLTIIVNIDSNQSVGKITELSKEQISNEYKIYISEQLNYELLSREYPDEKAAIDEQKHIRLNNREKALLEIQAA